MQVENRESCPCGTSMTTKERFDAMSAKIGELRLELRALEPDVPTEHTDIVWNLAEALMNAQGDVNLLSILLS
jgi:hypothetical protein